MSTCPSLSSLARYSALIALLAVLYPADPLLADVLTVGEVTPVPPENGGTSNSQLVVGGTANGSINGSNSNEIWGLVSIDDGTVLQYSSLIVGYNSGYFGQLDVTGDFLAGKVTQLNLSSTSSAAGSTAIIGSRGTGWLNVNGGARLTFTSSSGDLSLGSQPSGVGYATISDRFTLVTLSDSMYVGQKGIGDLQILNGALVRMLDYSTSRVVSIGVDPGSNGSVTVDGQGTLLRSAANLRVGESGQGSLEITHAAMVDVGFPTPPLIPNFPSVSIGVNANSVGSVIVDGTGSLLQTHDTLVVGSSGLGTLKIRNGGQVNITDKTAADSVQVGSLGRIELAGGTLSGSTPDAALLPTTFGTTVDGFLGGSGLVRGTVQFNENSVLEAYKGDLLKFQDFVSNQGAFTIDGGEVQFLAGLTNNAQGGFNASGRISLENSGTLRFAGPLTNDGVISNAHGTTNIHGEIDNPGDIVVARDTVATFHDSVNSTGTITVLPGGNALFLADLTFTATAALEMGVEASDFTASSPLISTNGVATLGGSLDISLDGGYSSLIGQSIELLSAGGGIFGAFDSIELPTLPDDIEVGVVYSPTSVVMQIGLASVSTSIPGDYNQDGTVNSADYTVWRNSLGQSGSGLAADGNGDTHVDEADYALWKLHFGETFGSGAGGSSNAATPEPASIVLALAAMLALTRIRRA
jgi:T5SS/PEP-CTERM-associated repeat protein